MFTLVVNNRQHNIEDNSSTACYHLKKEVAMSFAKRLSALMTQRGVSIGQLADATGRSRQSVSYWKTGRNEPTAEVLVRIADVLKVSPLWLKTGESDEKTEKVVVSEDVQGSAGYVFIPEYRLSFGCASGGCDTPEWVVQPDRQGAYRREFFQSRNINPERCRRARAEGDSMEPLICDGDTVLFVEEPEGSPVRDGHVYALRYGGSLKIKRLYRKANGDLIIRSDNSRYPDEVVPNSLTNELVQIYGPVIERSGTI